MMSYINVDIDLSDFDSADLLEELRIRDVDLIDPDIVERIQALYDKISTKQDYTKDLNDLIYHVLGRIV